MKATKWISAFILLATLTSCTFKEEIYINDDGSGKFALNADASAIMSMIPNDSLGDKGMKTMDSTFAFRDIFNNKKDSIAKLSKEEQARLKKLENFSMHINMNAEQKQLVFGVLSDFKNVSELQDAMSTMSEIKNIDKSKKAEAAPAVDFGKNNSQLSYTYNGKKFTRKATVGKNQVKESMRDSAMAAYKVIYDQSSYVINYHFPKKVKKVSNPNALFSEDRKTITIEYPFMDYIQDPEKLNFEVTFE